MPRPLESAEEQNFPCSFPISTFSMLRWNNICGSLFFFSGFLGSQGKKEMASIPGFCCPDLGKKRHWLRLA